VVRGSVARKARARRASAC
jgi:hypothetical protein